MTPEPEAASGAALRRHAGLRRTAKPSSACASSTARGEPVNEIVALPLDGSAEPRVLAAGHDFYSFPASRPDGAAIAWTCWDHPNMPWDGTELWVAPPCRPGRGGAGRRRSGGVDLPARLGRRGRLHFVSDRDGFWNLYRPTARRSCCDPRQADPALPQWLFGGDTYAFFDGGPIACVRIESGQRPAPPLARSAR